MKKNEKCEKAYKLHSRHINRDLKYVGEVESLEEIMDIVDEINPNVYMLGQSCVTGHPSLQLANWNIVRRMGLRLLERNQREDLLKILEEKGIEYRKTRYLCLTKDFKLTRSGKLQKPFRIFYDIYSYFLH